MKDILIKLIILRKKMMLNICKKTIQKETLITEKIKERPPGTIKINAIEPSTLDYKGRINNEMF